VQRLAGGVDAPGGPLAGELFRPPDFLGGGPPPPPNPPPPHAGGHALLAHAYAPGVAHYIFNSVKGDAAKGPPVPREQAAGFLRVRMWGIDADERHRDALAPGDLVLVYLGAPEREFIGRAELASAVHDWTPSEAEVYPGESPGGVLLARVEEWDPPVPMKTVLSQIDPAENAKADFQAGVVRITAHEYDTALAVAAGRGPSTG
jgi:hypothetical protein